MQLDTLTLPDNFIWVNEFDWSPVAQTTERSLTGALVVSESQKSYGRSIVLGDGENSWLTRAQVEALFILSEQPAHIMPLTLPDGRSFTVIFDRSEGHPIEAQQILPISSPADTDLYGVTLRFLTVQAHSE
ncbi:hypothetical protein [Sansalvadorimonas verongulae]|uniref:hypothetical protein n=1 Tax=Sansalvadorimonas verongulae TaxID=2172824 RepID=UPI0012BD1A37|nr:hypothetical protein [Sansalvadorimonas verongulae]MTI11888.1 hypothetical protein [Sansalvadorimonas verongulae]